MDIFKHLDLYEKECNSLLYFRVMKKYYQAFAYEDLQHLRSKIKEEMLWCMGIKQQYLKETLTIIEVILREQEAEVI